LVLNGVGNNPLHFCRHDRPAFVAGQRLENIAIFVHVLEKHAAEAEGGRLRHSTGRQRIALRSHQGRAQVLQPAQQQPLLASVMRIERRTTDVRPASDVLDRDPLVAFFQNQLIERGVQGLLRAFDAAIWFGASHGR